VYTLLKDILAPVIQPEKQSSAYVRISMALLSPGTVLYEVGTAAANIFSAQPALTVKSLYKGTIKNGIPTPATSELTGDITSTEYSSSGNGLDTDTSGNISGTMPQGTVNYTLTAYTAKGTTDYWNSNGDGTHDTAITTPAVEALRGPLTLTHSTSLYGGFYIVYGETELAEDIPDDRASLIGNAGNKVEELYLSGSATFDFASGSGTSTKKLYIFFPPTIANPSAPTNVRLLNTSSANDQLLDDANSSSVIIQDASGTNVTYKRYVVNIDGVGFSEPQNLSLQIGEVTSTFYVNNFPI
jgi:hypothetical protein